MAFRLFDYAFDAGVASFSMNVHSRGATGVIDTVASPQHNHVPIENAAGSDIISQYMIAKLPLLAGDLDFQPVTFITDA